MREARERPTGDSPSLWQTFFTQFRRRRIVYLRRSHHSADSQHLSKILWNPNDYADERCFYCAMVVAALIVESGFAAARWMPGRFVHASAHAMPTITMNYTSVLDIVFGIVSIVLFTVFLRTGGPDMMKHGKGTIIIGTKSLDTYALCGSAAAIVAPGGPRRKALCSSPRGQ